MESITLRERLVGLSEAEADVVKKLGDNYANYTQEQIDGATRAMEALEAQEKAYERQQELIGDLSSGFTDAIFDIADGTKSASEAFADMAQSILRNLGEMIIQQMIFNALSGALGGTGLGSILGFANGGAIANGSVVPFADGGVVSSPAMFPLSGGRTGLMGEAGPEAIIPLQRDSAGRLGVGGPSISINNYSGQEVTVTRSDSEVIEIAVGQARQAVAQDYAQSMQSGHGTYASALESSYRSGRKAF
ncbi:phage tail tape measure protein [Ruegeria sp. HKCCD4315]|nr:hypothetical protein [Ruegeria sp. HKCCD4318]NOE14261.1 hypothetical protein [Ruegeria sp. HKCCD4318-2]NOG08382.1 phage tail tape measure protein [Ruegeria sp. HKCCD4315]